MIFDESGFPIILLFDADGSAGFNGFSRAHGTARHAADQCAFSRVSTTFTVFTMIHRSSHSDQLRR